MEGSFLSMNGYLKLHIESILGESVREMNYGGGKIKTESGKVYFLKAGDVSRTYQCEANGLKELAKANVIRIADVIATGDDFILTEFIESGSPGPHFYEAFGKAFARLHRYHGPAFGFYEDNFIGANPQLNIPDKEEAYNWIAFFFRKRLLYQYKIAEKQGYVTPTLKKGFIRLESRIEELLKPGLEPPTLLHGDLWSGNYLSDKDSNAVLIDPAAYYGHREADLAMTRVFGGFPVSFYKAYQEEYPLPEGWEKREYVYKLYHILNHLNIFGRVYLAEAEYLVSQ